MNIEIHDGVVTLASLVALSALLSIWIGIRMIGKGRRLTYYRLRDRTITKGWWTILLALALGLAAFLIGRFAEPIAYRYFPPSPTPTLTPSITPTPTISLTPTISEVPSITPTPAISYTPTITSTPFVPELIAMKFESTVTPNPEAVFSAIVFSQTIRNYLPVDEKTVFENPVGQIFATFSYMNMNKGVQWTALWYRDGELVHYEMEAWLGGEAGYAYSLWEPLAEEWLPGTYQVIMFVGMEWKTLGEFRVTGNPPTPTVSPSPTISRTATKTPLPSATP